MEKDQTVSREFFESFIENDTPSVYNEPVELITYKYKIEMSYGDLREIIIVCYDVLNAFKNKVNSTEFDYNQLLQYLEESDTDITSTGDFDKIERLWRDKICTEQVAELMIKIFGIINTESVLTEQMNRCLIQLFICCYAAIAAELEEDPEFDPISYLNQTSITVIEMSAE